MLMVVQKYSLLAWLKYSSGWNKLEKVILLLILKTDLFNLLFKKENLCHQKIH